MSGRHRPASAAPPALRRAAVLCLLLAPPLILAAQFFTHITPDIVDDHFFGFAGQRIANGARLYLDVWDNKPPLIYWINAAATWLAAGSYQGPIIAAALAVLLAHAALFASATRLFAPGVALLLTLLATVYLTHPAWLGGANRPETYVVCFELAALACYLRSFRGLAPVGPAHRPGRGDTLWLLLTGAGCGAAVLCKQSGLALFGALFVHLLALAWDGVFRNRIIAWRLVLLLTGFGAVLAAAAGLLAISGALRASYTAIVTFNRLYFAAGDSHWWDLYRNTHFLLRNAAPVLQLLLVLSAAAVIHAVAGVLWRTAPAAGRPAGRLEVPFVSLLAGAWLLLAFYGAALSPHFLPHYIAPAVPPLLLLSGRLLHALTREWGLRHALAERASIALLLAACGAWAAAAVYRHAERDWRVAWARRATWTGAATVALAPTAWQTVGQRIRDRAQAGETLHCWGFYPGVYLEAGLPNVTRFFTYEKIGHLGDRADFIRREIRTALERRPPDWFVLSAGDWARLGEPGAAREASAADDAQAAANDTRGAGEAGVADEAHVADAPPAVPSEATEATAATAATEEPEATAASDWLIAWLSEWLADRYRVDQTVAGEYPFVILRLVPAGGQR